MNFRSPRSVGYTKRALKLPRNCYRGSGYFPVGGGRLGEIEICSVSLKLGLACKKVQKPSADH